DLVDVLADDLVRDAADELALILTGFGALWIADDLHGRDGPVRERDRHVDGLNRLRGVVGALGGVGAVGVRGAVGGRVSGRGAAGIRRRARAGTAGERQYARHAGEGGG